MTLEGYHALCSGVVERAILDYKNAAIGIGINRRPPELIQKDVERFFCSDYFLVFSDMDGKSLFSALKRNTEEFAKIKRQRREIAKLKREEAHTDNKVS